MSTAPLIVSDASIQFGEPTIAGSRITVRTIVERFYGGETIQAIAYEYEVTPEHVEAALRWGTRHRSSADIVRRLHRYHTVGQT